MVLENLKEYWSPNVKTNEQALYLTTVEFTVSTVDGYTEDPSNIAVSAIATVGGDGYYVVQLSEKFTSVRFVIGEVVTNAEDDADCVRIRGIDADDGKIYIQTQTSQGTDGALANGTKIMLLVAGVKSLARQT